MKHFLFPSFITAASLLLIACSGNSSSSSQKEALSAPPQESYISGAICPNEKVITRKNVDLLGDVNIVVSQFDTNNSGCLTPDENKKIDEHIAQLKKEKIQAMTLTVTREAGKHNVGFTSASIKGNSEVSDNRVQLHTNMDEGRLEITVEASIGDPEGQRIHFYFAGTSIKDGYKPADISAAPNKTPENGYYFHNLAVGKSVYKFSCQYQNPLTINCGEGTVLYGDNKEFQTKDHITLSSVFRFNSSAPQKGFFVATSCKAQTCFENYIEIPVSFN